MLILLDATAISDTVATVIIPPARTNFEIAKDWAQFMSFLFVPISTVGIAIAVITWYKNRKRFDYDLINNLNTKYQEVMKGLAITKDINKNPQTLNARISETKHYILCYLENCEEELQYIEMGIVNKRSALMWIAAMIKYVPSSDLQYSTDPKKLITYHLQDKNIRDKFMNDNFREKLNLCRLLQEYIYERKTLEPRRILTLLKRHRNRRRFPILRKL